RPAAGHPSGGGRPAPPAPSPRSRPRGTPSPRGHERAAWTSIGAVAVIVGPADNVAVVKTAVEAGLTVETPDRRAITLTGPVTPGHRFATRSIPDGQFVLQYGQPIGTSRGIAEGDPITVRNMSNDVPVVRDLPANLHTP